MGRKVTSATCRWAPWPQSSRFQKIRPPFFPLPPHSEPPRDQPSTAKDMHRKPKNSSAHLHLRLVTSPETPAPACHRHFPECPENATTSSTTGTTSIHDSRIAMGHVTTSMDHPPRCQPVGLSPGPTTRSRNARMPVSMATYLSRTFVNPLLASPVSNVCNLRLPPWSGPSTSADSSRTCVALLAACFPPEISTMSVSISSKPGLSCQPANGFWAKRPQLVHVLVSPPAS